MRQLKLGIPKGSLQQSTIELFKKSGWRIDVHPRSYFPDIDDPDISCSICRAQEMSRYVEQGILDIGITGHDWILENGSDVVVIADLIYSKISKRPTRWVLAVPAGSPYRRPEDLKGKKIATELVNFSRHYFAERGIDVEIEFSWGATEGKVASGLADAIVEVTETGATIKAHGLVIIEELMESNPQLIANRDMWKDPWKREKAEQIALLLQGALRADRLVVIKMNVPQERLEEVAGLLPSLNAPTVSPLYDKEWCSVETVIDKARVRELIPRLKAAGAQGIIEYSLNKVL